MRVIAGKRRGTILVGPEQYEGTRPISDRAKEALFSIVQSRVAGAQFLDLFAGTGGVGIEALSRDAAHVTFVELSSTPVSIIRRNLARTGFTSDATVVHGDALAFVGKTKGVYDIVFVAPPQWHGIWRTSLEILDGRACIVRPTGIVVLQCDPSEYEPCALVRLEEIDRRKYGGVQLTFFIPRPER